MRDNELTSYASLKNIEREHKLRSELDARGAHRGAQRAAVAAAAAAARDDSSPGPPTAHRARSRSLDSAAFTPLKASASTPALQTPNSALTMPDSALMTPNSALKRATPSSAEGLLTPLTGNLANGTPMHLAKLGNAPMPPLSAGASLRPPPLMVVEEQAADKAGVGPLPNLDKAGVAGSTMVPTTALRGAFRSTELHSVARPPQSVRLEPALPNLADAVSSELPNLADAVSHDASSRVFPMGAGASGLRPLQLPQTPVSLPVGIVAGSRSTPYTPFTPYTPGSVGLGRHGLPTCVQPLPTSGGADGGALLALPTCGKPVCSQPNLCALPAGLPSVLPSSLPTAHHANAMPKFGHSELGAAGSGDRSTGDSISGDPISLAFPTESQCVTAIAVEPASSISSISSVSSTGLPAPLRFVTADDAGGMCAWRLSCVAGKAGGAGVPPTAPTYKVELLKRWRGTAEEDKVLGIGGNNSISGVVVIAARRIARGGGGAPLSGAPLLGAPLMEDDDEVTAGASVPLVVVAACANGTLSAFGVNSGQRLGLMPTSGLTTGTGSRPNTPASVTSTALLAGAPGTWHDYNWQLPLHAHEDATLAETVNDLADELRMHVPSSALPLFPRATVAEVGGAATTEEDLPKMEDDLPKKGKLLEKALATLAQVTAEAPGIRLTSNWPDCISDCLSDCLPHQVTAEAEAARDTTHLELAADLSDGNPAVRRRAAEELRKHQLLFSYLDKSVPPRQRAAADGSKAGARKPSHEEGSDGGASKGRSPEALAFARKLKEAREAVSK